MQQPLKSKRQMVMVAFRDVKSHQMNVLLVLACTMRTLIQRLEMLHVTGSSVLMKTVVCGCIQNVWTNVMETMCAVYVKLSLVKYIPVFYKYVVSDY